MVTATGMPSWTQGATPHRDIREGRVSEVLFAVNLSRAIAREGVDEYRDPKLFFTRTFLTKTIKELLRDVVYTLTGQPVQNRVIQLQTNFGGGKTHAELAIYHLLTSRQEVAAVPSIAAFLAEIGVADIPAATVAAMPCADLYAGGREVPEGFTVRTLWGELAYRLGGAALFELVRDSDTKQTPPGAETLRALLRQAGPNVILIDELLHYVDKAAAIQVGNSDLGSQTIAFLRELTEAVESAPASALIASLTASKVEDITVLSRDQAEFTLSKLEDVMRRTENSRAPIQSQEIYEVVRARLFDRVDLDAASAAAEAYFRFYRSDQWRDLLPDESRGSSYRDLLAKSYPFHPSVIKVLYERWGSRPQFQLTRGTLRFLSYLLAHLCNGSSKTRGDAPLIQLSDVNLSAEKVRAEVLAVAGGKWESIIGADLAVTEPGGAAIAQKIDLEHGGLYERYRVVDGLATSVFMYTQGGTQSKGTPRADIRLAVARPWIPLADLDQAFADCRARLYYYYEEDGGCIFKTEPNPNKVLADERANITTDSARQQVERVVSDVVGRSTTFNVVLYGFVNSAAKEPAQVPDEDRLQLVVLPLRATASEGRLSGTAAALVTEIAENYANRHRYNRNLVLFLVADSQIISGAIDRAIDWLAANRVLSDRGLLSRFSEADRLTIQDRATEAENDVKEYVRKAYSFLFLPAVGGYEPFVRSYVPPNKSVLEVAARELLERGKIQQGFNPELLTGRWASLWPATATVIGTRDLWSKFARQTGSPILTSVQVFEHTILAGAEAGLFGYGVLRDAGQEKLQAASYERVYLGKADARELRAAAVDDRTVLIRPEQVYALFPPVTKEEVAMLLHEPTQTVQSIFETARNTTTVQGRVDERTILAAVADGVGSGLFGYAASPDSPVLRGNASQIAPEQFAFPGILVREDVPVPVSADEVVRLVPDQGTVPVRQLYEAAINEFGSRRVSEQAVLYALRSCVEGGRCAYSTSAHGAPITGSQDISLNGFVGKPQASVPIGKGIHLHGKVVAKGLASIVKMAMALGSLGNASITLDMHIQFKGAVNDHTVETALAELRANVADLRIEYNKGEAK